MSSTGGFGFLDVFQREGPVLKWAFVKGIFRLEGPIFALGMIFEKELDINSSQLQFFVGRILA